MITSIHEYRDASNSDKNCLPNNSKQVSKSDASSNVVLFSQRDSRKEKARADLLRAAQKIHW
jgi:hypothetical protein